MLRRRHPLQLTQQRAHLIAAVFAALWFAYVIPAHQRGMVKLPGLEPIEPACEHCVPATTNPDDAPPPNAGSCAICFIKANLGTPPLPTLLAGSVRTFTYLPYLDEPALTEQVAHPISRSSRAPPLSAL